MHPLTIERCVAATLLIGLLYLNFHHVRDAQDSRFSRATASSSLENQTSCLQSTSKEEALNAPHAPPGEPESALGQGASNKDDSSLEPEPYSEHANDLGSKPPSKQITQTQGEAFKATPSAERIHTTEELTEAFTDTHSFHPTDDVSTASATDNNPSPNEDDPKPIISSPDPPPNHPLLNSSKVAVIIENRPMSNLVPVILHFATVLGPEWPIRIFHSAENKPLFTESAIFRHHTFRERIQLTEIEEGDWFKDHHTYSKYITRPETWRNLAPAKHVLLFQTDSTLCSNSPRRVEDYLEYDFIGAPIAPAEDIKGFNGGLSLRNRETMLKITEIFPFDELYEDQWFYNKLRQMNEQNRRPGSREPWANLPSVEVAVAFSVETIWSPYPLGAHQLRRFLPERVAELEEWCPEYKMADDGSLSQSDFGAGIKLPDDVTHMR